MGKKHRHAKKRRTHVKPRRTAPGAAPGTLVADPAAPKPVISVLAYGPDRLLQEEVADPSRLRDYIQHWPMTWINVDGLGDTATIEAIGEALGLHHLALEDVVNTHQRPKLEEYGDHLFIVVRMPHPEEPFQTEQLSLFLGANYVITFQERAGDCFEPVRKRIRERRNRLLEASYLAYSLIDALVDSYFPVLDTFSDRLERLEDEVVRKSTATTVSQVHEVRHDLLALRRSIWPARDILNSLVRDPLPLISDTTRTYFRDCYDHAVRIIDLVETFRELSSSLIELYQSTVGQRMNEIMKVLTVIATIFIPLTFIAGLYGMNFNTQISPLNLPELNWYYGYPFALAVMVLVVAAMIVYFRRRGWIGA